MQPAPKENYRPIRSWLTMLNQYNVRYLALDKQGDRELVVYFQTHPGWAIDFEDQEGMVFVRANTIQA